VLIRCVHENRLQVPQTSQIEEYSIGSSKITDLLSRRGNFYERPDVETGFSVTCNTNAHILYVHHLLTSVFVQVICAFPCTLPLSWNLIIQDRIALLAGGLLLHAKRKLPHTEHIVTYYRRQCQCPLQLKVYRACAWSMSKRVCACVCETHLCLSSSRRNNYIRS
jgi:hypothetical protein